MQHGHNTIFIVLRGDEFVWIQYVRCYLYVSVRFAFAPLALGLWVGLGKGLHYKKNFHGLIYMYTGICITDKPLSLKQNHVHTKMQKQAKTCSVSIKPCWPNRNLKYELAPHKIVSDSLRSGWNTTLMYCISHDAMLQLDFPFLFVINELDVITMIILNVITQTWMQNC